MLENNRIFAIILNWNNFKDTKEAINSLLLSTYSPSQIIVVDNGSTDGSIEKLQRDFKHNNQVKFILNQTNLGFAKGINIGISYALSQGADFIFILNNDAIIDKDCISVLLKEMRKDETIGIAGPRIFYYKNSQKIWHGGGYFSYLKSGVIIPEKNKFENKCDISRKQITFLTGCSMLIKREVFVKIGLFDEDYFLYEEDVDFCLRAIRAGFKLIYVPAGKVWHKIENIAKDRTSPFIMYHMAKSRLIMLRKNFSLFYFFYGLCLHFLLFTPFRFLQIILGSRSPKSLLAWLQGTLAGVFDKLNKKS